MLDRLECDGAVVTLSEVCQGQWYGSDLVCHHCGERWSLAHQGQMERYPCPECGYRCQWPPSDIQGGA